MHAERGKSVPDKGGEPLGRFSIQKIALGFCVLQNDGFLVCIMY